MKLILIHQHDPTVPHVGGIQTFIDTFIRNAPEDLDIRLVGVTDQPGRYPVGRWHNLSMDQRRFRFFPLVAANPMHVPVIPLSLKMLLALYRYRKEILSRDAILEFHRIEPMLAFPGGNNPRILFLHGHNGKDFYNKKTEVRWGKLPWLYFWLERKLLPRADHVYLVREDAVGDYQQLYPDKKHQISFLPTWVDETVFHSLDGNERRELRKRLMQEQDLSSASKILLFVGRYEGQKDPLRLLQAFRHVKSREPGAYLVMIGEGSLKGKMQKYVGDNDLSSAVRFLPPMSQNEIGQWMNTADALCLSSAFEGMPRVVVEALYCGLPVVGTAVGETGRLVGGTRGGRIVTGENAEDFARAVLDLFGDPPSAEACRKQVESFTARRILASVYRQYREIATARP